MGLKPLIGILFILLLILANGFFSNAELALLAVRKSRLETLAKEGNKRAAVALNLAKNPNQLLSTIQIGITFVGIVSGVLAGSTLSDVFAGTLLNWGIKAPFNQMISYTLFVILITYLSIVIGELIPKRLAMNDPEKFALRSAGVMRGLEWVANPLVKLLSHSTNLGLKSCV